MNSHQLSASIPIVGGLLLLCHAVSKKPTAKILRPTLLVVSVCAVAFGLLIILLDDLSFRRWAGRALCNWLHNMKLLIGGVAVGAAVSSVLHGHWKAAWLLRSRDTGFQIIVAAPIRKNTMHITVGESLLL